MVLFLGAVVLFLVAQLLVPSLLLFRLEAGRNEVQQAALTFMHRLQKEMLNTDLATVSLGEEPPSLAFQEMDEADPYDVGTGRPKFSPWFVLYYYDSQQQAVVWKRWPPEPPARGSYTFEDPTLPQALGAGYLSAVCSQSNGTERVLVRGVSSLEISDMDGDPSILHPPLAFTIICRVDVSGGGGEKREEVYTLTSRLLPRNVGW
ncbi:MAG TPA: hypothetical protein VNO81_03180 [Candidatus Nitrosotenuis sp.]|nr:hypothetical protein [Candidatus Nitrosotenuis sp.]